jgi:hypothetical protein
MSSRPSPTQSQFFENPLLLDRSVDPPPIRLADLKNDRFPSWRPSLDNLDPLALLSRLEPLAFARYLITFLIGAAVALAWQSHGSATREAASLKAISLDREAVQQSIDRLAITVASSQEQMTSRIERSIERGIDRLAAGQEQTTRGISDLRTFEQHILDRISTPPRRSAPIMVSKPVPRWPQAATQLTPTGSP